MDIFYIIVASICGVFLLIGSIYILAIYCHPEDGGIGSSLWCKFLVVFGLSLSWLQVLLIPLDIYNSRGAGQGLDLTIMWEIVYMSILGMISFLLPTAIFMYESDEELSIIKRIMETIFQEFAVLLIFGVGLIVSFFYLRKTYIPIEVQVMALTNDLEQIQILPGNFVLQYTDYTEMSTETAQQEVGISPTMEISFPIYTISMISFLGFFFFIIFGGAGLSALPIELIRSFNNRPKVVTKMILNKIYFYKKQKSIDIAAKKHQLLNQTKLLIKLGEKMQGKYILMNNLLILFMNKDDEKEANFAKGGFFERRRRKSKFRSAYKTFNTAVQTLQEVKY